MQSHNGYRQTSISGIPKFKVVLLGEAGVGKSAIFSRVKDNVFADHLQPTLGIDSCSKLVTVDRDKVMLQIWDTAGAERYRTLTRNYYRNTHALFLVYSLDNPASLHYLTKWLEDSMDASPNALAFLIGNKSDLERSVTKDSVVDFAEAHGFEGAFDMSAKTGKGINHALRKVGRKLLDSFQFPLRSDSLFDDNINVNIRNRHESTSCSCRI